MGRQKEPSQHLRESPEESGDLFVKDHSTMFLSDNEDANTNKQTLRRRWRWWRPFVFRELRQGQGQGGKESFPGTGALMKAPGNGPGRC